jgi:GNAT superfamily N-acetyltransferase
MIRPVGPADIAAAAGLMADSPLLLRYRVTFEVAKESLSEALNAADLLLAEENEASLRGFAWCSFASRLLNGAAYLRLLLVADAAQGCGIGSRLLQAVEARACERANHLYLLATTDNLHARRFYERRGYRHVGDLPGLVCPDLDEALYHKMLRSVANRIS